MAHSKHLLRELATLPWWVGLVAAGVVYVALRWVFPVIAGSSVLLKGLAEAFSGKAAQQQRLRNRQAERLGGLRVDELVE